MILKWLGIHAKQCKTTSLSAIFIADKAGHTMQSVKTVEAVSGKGLAGDRYHNKSGYWDPVEGCQVTLISEHDLKQAKHGTELNFDNGQHRRNLVIHGIKTKTLQGKNFQIGEAIFSYHKPRPPCGYLNKIEGRGMAKALSYNSGICVRVIRSGKMRVGDALIILGSSDV